ncbi:response regulator [Reinekea sp.]|jgi:two-component system response regulator DesR|uniref:response regulator n=1 Tax=Reinekea sp. TaxID=1970455 RepID=UPI003989585F
MPKIKLLIAEDQAMVRGALSALLNMTGHFDVVIEARNGDEAFELVKNNSVDIVLTDIEMPGRTGLELAADIFKRIEMPPKVVLLSTFSRQGYAQRARELGVQGYLLKEAPSDDLALSLKKVMRGHIIYDPSLESEPKTHFDPLQDRERIILRLAEQGVSTAEIAKVVSRSEGTVRNALSDVIKKLAVSNRTEAIRLARDKGWL